MRRTKMDKYQLEPTIFSLNQFNSTRRVHSMPIDRAVFHSRLIFELSQFISSTRTSLRFIRHFRLLITTWYLAFLVFYCISRKANHYPQHHNSQSIDTSFHLKLSYSEIHNNPYLQSTKAPTLATFQFEK